MHYWGMMARLGVVIAIDRFFGNNRYVEFLNPSWTNMSLKLLSFPGVVDSSSHNLVTEFFQPALANSTQYDRGVGYFSSGWLRVNAQGLGAFAANGGRARWVTSPILAPDDWEALQLGDEGRSNAVLYAALRRNIDDLKLSLERETLSALAWMIADGILTFRLAVPQNKLSGDFHDKFGVFSDFEGNRIAFMGSYNESKKGSLNSESFSVFPSWREPILLEYVESIERRFTNLWANQDPNVRVFDLPEAAKEAILQLRSEPRPYPKPEWMNGLKENPAQYLIPRPRIPTAIKLRDYQEQAIGAWLENDCRGLLEMATGTGKTITALAAAARLFERETHLAVVIAVPYQHLVDQWNREAEAFGFQPILAYRSRQSWLDTLYDAILSFNHGDRQHLCVIVTHATFSTEHFQGALKRIDRQTLIIGDEAHHLGAETRRTHFPEQIPFRLALSATPDRWFDDDGTAALRAYFGSTVFEFSLAQAIGFSLTPYYYHPILVELTPEEMEEYRVLSIRIAQLLANDRDLDDERLGALLRRRATLLNASENKIEVLSELLGQPREMSHTLFYCAPGQIDDVVRLLGWEKSLLVNRFTAREDIPTRRDLLQRFDSGQIQALAAMHCLDEGVDVPSTRTAYILASSGNPRQFIQRRGRVLRRYPGKDHAVIYDLISIPPTPESLDPGALGAERAILKRELKRFVEFADSAQNTQQAYDVIWDLAERYGIMDFG